MVSHKGLRDLVVNTAEEAGIPYQFDSILIIIPMQNSGMSVNVARRDRNGQRRHSVCG
jgi:hypothetical protein